MRPAHEARRIDARTPSAAAVPIALALVLGAVGCAGRAARGRPEGEAQPPVQPFQIREAQRALDFRGYPVQVTGALDEPTRTALARFQSSKGLPQTGLLDDATARELRVSLDPMYNCEIYDTVDCGPPGGP